jgi:hypothetical protein
MTTYILGLTFDLTMGIEALITRTRRKPLNKIFFNLCLAGNWGTWASWTTCTLTCGGGSQARTRLCNNPAPSFGGANCAGSGAEFQACNTQACGGVVSKYLQ